MQAFIAKFYEAVIIALTAFLLLALLGFGIQSWRVGHYENEYTLLDAKYKTEVAEAKALTEQSKAEARTKEKVWSEKLLKAEQNHNAKMQEIMVDVNRAQSTVNSMSKQIDSVSKRMSTASRETIIEYVYTSGDILKECVAEYREVAEKADGHAIDAKRLSDSWAD